MEETDLRTWLRATKGNRSQLTRVAATTPTRKDSPRVAAEGDAEPEVTMPRDTTVKDRQAARPDRCSQLLSDDARRESQARRGAHLQHDYSLYSDTS